MYLSGTPDPVNTIRRFGRIGDGFPNPDCRYLPKGNCNYFYTVFCKNECETRKSELENLEKQRKAEEEKALEDLIASIGKPPRCILPPGPCGPIDWVRCTKECRNRKEKLRKEKQEADVDNLGPSLLQASSTAEEAVANPQCSKLPAGYCDPMYHAFCPRECNQRWLQLSSTGVAMAGMSRAGVQSFSTAAGAALANPQCGSLPVGHCHPIYWAFCKTECQKQEKQLGGVAASLVEASSEISVKT